jgi:hypothetical protein
MRGFGKLLGAVSVSLATLAAPHLARAADEEPSSSGKGVVGGALLGAEAVTLVEAAANVKPPWAYLVGGGLGAVAGGVGGFFAEDANDSKLSLYLLAGGMTLIIPTTVAILSATSFEPTNYTEDRPPVDEPVAEPPQPTSPPPAAPSTTTSPGPTGRLPVKRAPVAKATHKAQEAAPRIAKLPPALVGVGGGSLSLSVPAVVVKPVFTRSEVAMLGVKQQTEVEVPLLNVSF